MSISARKELLSRIKAKYQAASWEEKNKILSAFVDATGYRRKYAIHLLNVTEEEIQARASEKRERRKRYDEAVRLAFMTVWRWANEICPKRLVPFLPRFVEALERHGHLSLPADVRDKLLSMSISTAERLLRQERREKKRGVSTTRPGSLLKKQIPTRTFADWNDVCPGFVEADLVAHCGDDASGTFLNTLVMTDIASCWTECIPLLRRSEADVSSALSNIKELLPFELVGLDTDNGSEFINHELLKYCETNGITFTKGRAYRKNDQAHVEEKNGSIVRRIVGYDRFEGLQAWRALAALYAKLRLYVNYFQPSQKLLERARVGSKTVKRYDMAKTPCQRLIDSNSTTLPQKNRLEATFVDLDPVSLLNQIQKLQEELEKHAWQKPAVVNAPDLVAETISQIYELEEPRALRSSRRYHRGKKPRKPMAPRTWRTRKDPFENCWKDIRTQLELDPTRTAKSLLDELIKKHPGEFHLNQRRTLQRRILAWRKTQLALQAQHEKLTLGPETTIQIFTDLANLAASR